MSAFLDALPSAAPGPDVVETKTFRVGIGPMPFLADHGFHGLTIAPGSLSLALALRVFSDTRWLPVVRFTKVKFHQPLILTGPPIELAVELAWRGEQQAHGTLREAPAARAGEAPATTLEITGGFEHDLAPARPAVTTEAFQHRAGPPLDGATFYRRLLDNGNRYGPRFQGLQQLWRAGDEVLARLSLARGTAEEFFLDPIVLDAALQSLTVFGLERGRTLVLRGIDEALLRRPSGSTQGWVTARLRPAALGDPDALVGDIEVRDDAGECWLELRGVTWSFHDTKSGAALAADAAMSLVVAATFTAEPIAEVFRFWSDTLALPTRVSFAPYNQVFQSLLDPQSEFRRNRDGCNVLLVNLADWATASSADVRPLERARADACFADLDRCTLPNGLEIAQLNRHETDYVYREIFSDRCYLRHGIRLPKAGTVIDIGANIGLFALFVHTEAPGATVLAYEPSPAAFRALQANCEAYGPNLRAFNLGVAERRGDALLTCYEKSSVFSSFHADADEDRQAIRAVAANVLRQHMGDDAIAPAPGEVLDELLADRLKAQTIACPVVSVSDLIRNHHLARIDLLKIDAEKCEEEILRGIEDEHWPLIDQIVVEVHDRTRVLLERVQAMLTHRGFHCAVVEETLLTGSGLFNVYATRNAATGSGSDEEGAASSSTDSVRRTADEFADALATFVSATATPTLLAVTPRDPRGLDGATAATLADIERTLLHRARLLPRVHAVGSAEIVARYPASDFHQADARQLGHVAYTPEGFAAIGTSVFRQLAALRRAPFKVIALDCDHTLWQGGCGDDGALGITVTPPHRALQEFMLRQREAGMLLCLCSKNNEASVWAVFERNPGMVLKREHLTATRINWDAKSANLRSLATQLNVGADSILFLDDNPTERAEVRAHCPGVAVLPLPAGAADFPRFLEQMWAFDYGSVTADDRARAQRMAESEQREKFRTEAPTLQSFIAGLDLRVNIFIPEPHDFARVAQLTQRTNQFNFSTVRRTEGELRQFLETPHHHGLAVHVADRFGDYGLVGVVLYETEDDCLRVDTFLLSCRVLGRGVEHQIVASLGRRALAAGKTRLAFALRPMEKNQPARDFVATLAATPLANDASGMTHGLAAEQAAALRYAADRPATPHEPGPASAGAPPATLSRLSENFDTIAALDDARKISAAVERHRRRASHSPAAEDSASAETLTGKLLRLCRRILDNPNFGLDDKFMDAGGTSLTAVLVVAAVRKELQLPLSVVAFFESPTVRLLSEKLSGVGKPETAGSEALQRGARRAHRFGKKAP